MPSLLKNKHVCSTGDGIYGPRGGGRGNNREVMINPDYQNPYSNSYLYPEGTGRQADGAR